MVWLLKLYEESDVVMTLRYSKLPIEILKEEEAGEGRKEGRKGWGEGGRKGERKKKGIQGGGFLCWNQDFQSLGMNEKFTESMKNNAG